MRAPFYPSRRPLSWVLAALLLLVAAPSFAFSLNDWGARSAWDLAKRALPGKLEGEFVEGALTRGVELRNVVYRDETRVVRVDRLSVNWQVSISPLKLTLGALHLRTVDMTSKPTPPTEPTLPQEIKLPIAVELKQARIDRLLMREEGKDATEIRDIRLSLHTDGTHHQLTLDNAVTPFGTARAALKLDGVQPFPLTGNAGLDTDWQDARYRLDARLSGSLRALGVQLTVSGNTLDGKADIEATPFDPVPFRRAQIDVRHLNPRVFSAGAPQADLDVRATLMPQGAVPPGKDLSALVVSGPVSVSNAKPGRIDQELLPLVSARAQVRLDARTQQLSQLVVQLPGQARLQGGGTLRASAQGQRNGNFTLDAQHLDLAALHATFRKTELNGPLTVELAGESQRVKLALAGAGLAMQADAALTPQQITLHGAQLQAGASRLEASGTLGRDARSTYAFKGKLTNFEPSAFLASMPVAAKAKGKGKDEALPPIDARINADFQARGALQPEFSTSLTFDVHDSVYAKLPMSGGGTLHLAGTRVLPSEVQLTVAGNEVVLKGSFGAPSDRLNVHVDAPALAGLGVGASGLLQVDGQIGGTLKEPLIDLNYRAEQLAYGDYRAALLSGRAQSQGLPGSRPDAPLKLALEARDLQGGELQLSRLDADIDGSFARHAIRLSAAGRVQDEALDLSLAAQGQLRQQSEGYAWNGTLEKLQSEGLLRAALDAPLAVSVAPDAVELGASRLTVERAAVELQGLRYAAGKLHTAGAFDALDVGHLLEMQRRFTGSKAPVTTTLVLDGRWNVTLAESADGFVEITRTRGDIAIPGPAGDSPMGLRALALRANLQGQRIALDARAEAERIGTLTGQGEIGLQQQDGSLRLTPDAPLSARIAVAVPQLQRVASLAGPRVALDGSVAADIRIAGTLGAPQVSGTIDGERLAVTQFDQGVRLRDGVAHIAIENNIVDLREVAFQGGDGTLRITGRIPLDESAPELGATIVADKLQLLASPTGQMTVSGRAQAARVNQQLQVSGNFKVDQALFSLPEKSAPSLDDDVVVVRDGQRQAPRPSGPRPASPWSPLVRIDVDLGDDFRFRGSGADLRLGGALEIRSAPGETPQAFGTVRVENGVYEAFGTKLTIERGLINFLGPFTNPNLNILAMRRDREVAAGVQITGNVQRPRVQLVSEPDVPDSEKLSWLVFGRASNAGSESGQAQVAAKGAALGLLNNFGGGPVAKRFGLDQLSIGSSEFGLANQQVVSLGKEISNRLYVGYEQSLAGAESVLKLTYELSRNWSVVLRGGTVTGLDVLFNRRFDRFRKD